MRQKKNQFLKEMKKFIIFIYCGLCRDRVAEEKRIIVMIQMLSVWALNGMWKLPCFQAWYILQWRKTINFLIRFSENDSFSVSKSMHILFFMIKFSSFWQFIFPALYFLPQFFRFFCQIVFNPLYTSCTTEVKHTLKILEKTSVR